MKDLEPIPFAKAEAENHIARANAYKISTQAEHHNMHYALALKYMNALNNLLYENNINKVYLIRKDSKNVLSLLCIPPIL